MLFWEIETLDLGFAELVQRRSEQVNIFVAKHKYELGLFIGVVLLDLFVSANGVNKVLVFWETSAKVPELMQINLLQKYPQIPHLAIATG